MSADDEDEEELQRIRYQAANILGRIESRSSPKQKQKQKEKSSGGLFSSLKKINMPKSLNMPSLKPPNLSAMSLQPLAASVESFIHNNPATTTTAAKAAATSTAKKKAAATTATAVTDDENNGKDDDVPVSEILPPSPPRSSKLRLFGDQVILFSEILRDDIRLVRSQVMGLPTEAMEVVYGLLGLKPTVGWSEYPSPSNSSWFSPIVSAATQQQQYKGLRFHVYDYVDDDEEEAEADKDDATKIEKEPKLRIWTFACVYDAEIITEEETKHVAESFLEELVMITSMPRQNNDPTWVRGDVDACVTAFDALLEHKMKEFKVATTKAAAATTSSTSTSTTPTKSSSSSSSSNINEIMKSNTMALERYEKRIAHLKAERYAMVKQKEAMRRALELEQQQQQQMKAQAEAEAAAKEAEEKEKAAKKQKLSDSAAATSSSDKEKKSTGTSGNEEEQVVFVDDTAMKEVVEESPEEEEEMQQQEQEQEAKPSSTESDKIVAAKTGGAGVVTTIDRSEEVPKEQEKHPEQKKTVPNNKDKDESAAATSTATVPDEKTEEGGEVLLNETEEKKDSKKDKEVPSKDEATAVSSPEKEKTEEEILKEMERMNKEVQVAAAKAANKIRKAQPTKEDALSSADDDTAAGGGIQAGRSDHKQKNKKGTIPSAYMITAAVIVLVSVVLAGIMQPEYPSIIPESFRMYSHNMLALFKNQTTTWGSGGAKEKGTEKEKKKNGGGMKSKLKLFGRKKDQKNKQ